MNGTGSAREALLAETLGEMVALLDRMEAVAPVLEASRVALINTSAELVRHISAFESRLVGITEHAKAQAVGHMARRADEIARASAKAQIREMEETARTLFQREVKTALQRVAMPLQNLTDLAHRGAHPWRHWLTHAATAVSASAFTLALAVWFWAA